MRTLLVALATALLALPASAQHRPWSHSVALAGADFALARGFAAVESNPANIFVGEALGLTFGASVHGGRMLVDGAGLRDLADIIRAAGSGDPRLLDGVPATGLRVDGFSEAATATLLAELLDVPDPANSVNVPTFGLSYKHFGLVFRQQTVVSAEVSRELVDLAVNGFQPEQIDEYAALTTGLRSFTTNTITVGLSRHYGRLSAGFGLRYILGRKLIRGRMFEPEVDVDAEELSATAAAVESRGGSGGALDVGLTYEVSDGAFVSLAVQNLFQRMYWDEELLVSQSAFTQADLGGTDVRLLIDRFQPRPLNPEAATLEAYETASVLFDESFLPRVVRFGLGWRPGRATGIQFLASKTVGAGQLVPPRMDRVAAGIEHRLGFVALRAGAALEEGQSRELAGGFALMLGFMHLDFGGGWTSGHGSRDGTLQGFSGSFGLSLRFPYWGFE